jgi:hypothetical protein
MRSTPIESETKVQQESIEKSEHFGNDMFAVVSGANFHPREEFSDGTCYFELLNS